jgi:arginase
MTARRVDVVGVPFDSAGTTSSVARAPAALRDAGLIEALRLAGIEATDRGDLPLGPTDPARDPISSLIAPGALTAMIPAVREAVDASLRGGAFPLVIGGDCPVLLGCLGGAGDRGTPPALLFVDGHEDAWPPQVSTTGEAADMELGFALGLTLDGLPADLIAEIPRLDPGRVLVLGPRDWDELAASNVPSIEGTVEVVRGDALVSADPRIAGTQAGAKLARQGPWWFHVDLDVLATESLAAVDYPQPGGLDWDALLNLSIGALSNVGVLGWDVTIYNPDLDPSGQGARQIVRYLAAALRG